MLAFRKIVAFTFLAGLMMACEGADLSQQQSDIGGQDKQYSRPTQIAGINLFECKAFKRVSDPSQTDIVCAVRNDDTGQLETGATFNRIQIDSADGNTAPIIISNFTNADHPDWLVRFTLPSAQVSGEQTITASVRVNGVDREFKDEVLIKAPTPLLHVTYADITNPYPVALRNDSRGVLFLLCSGSVSNGLDDCADAPVNVSVESPKIESIHLPQGINFAGSGVFPGGIGKISDSPTETGEFCTVTDNKIVQKKCYISVVQNSTTLGQKTINASLNYDGGAKIETLNLTSRVTFALIPNRVIGQPNLLTTSSGTGPSKLNGPEAVSLMDSNSMLVADTGNNRVLRFPVTLANNPQADRVVGQSNYTDSGIGSLSHGYYSPNGLSFDATAIYVNDRYNNRVSNFTRNDLNFEVPFLPTQNAAFQFQNLDPTELVSSFVMSSGRRLLTAFHSNMMPNASVVHISSSFATSGQKFDKASMAGGGTASLLYASYAHGQDGNGSYKLAVTDASAHRILIWNSDPSISPSTYTARTPDIVLGQNLFTNDPSEMYAGSSLSRMNNPSQAIFYNSNLFVSDSGNNRILIWRNLNSGDGLPANYEIKLNINNLATRISPLKGPKGIYVDINKKELYIADTQNNRIVVVPLPEEGDW